MAEDLGALVVRIEANINNLSKNFAEAERKMDNMGKKASGLGRVIEGAFSFAGGLGIFKVFDSIVGGLKSGVEMGLDFDSTMQQNKIAFESMLGSAEKADDILGKLSKMAAETPFEFPELTTAAKKMLAFGFEAEKIPGMMKNIGDAAAGLGLGAEGVSRITIALGQMQAKQKIQAGEMLQLTEAGVPALDILAKHFGKTTAEISQMQEKGLLPVRESIDALIVGMGDRFPNMMGKQSKSFVGLMSTLKDNVQMTLGQVLKPAFDNMTNVVLPAIIEKTGIFQAKFQETGSIFQALAATLGLEGGKMSGTITAIKDGFNAVFTFLRDVVFPPVTQVLQFLANEVIPTMGAKVQEWMPTIAQLFSDAWDAIKLIIDALVIAFDFAWPYIKDVVLNVLNIIGEQIGGMLKVLDGVINFLVGVFTGDWKRAWGGIKEIFEGIWQAVAGTFKGVINNMIAMINFFIRGLNKISFSIPEWVPGLGGKSFGISIAQIPKLKEGTNLVPFDTMAFLHKGEAVIPAAKNPGNPGATNPIGGLTINVQAGMVVGRNGMDELARIISQKISREYGLSVGGTF